MEIQNKERWAHCKQIFLRQCAVAVVICILAMLIHKELLYSWIIGCIIAILDTTLVLHGIYKGMQQDMEASITYMRKTMYMRFILLLIIVLVMLKLKLSVIGIFLSFLLLHIFLVLNLIIITSQNKTN